MDELSVLKARVIILERQMNQMNAQLKQFIEAFGEFRRYSRPIAPSSATDRDPGSSVVTIVVEDPIQPIEDDMEWDYNMATLGVGDPLEEE